MKKIILVSILVVALFIVGCGQQVVCNKPYILVGSECCLDQDDNGICDRDETKEEEKAVQEEEPEIEAKEKPKEEEVKITSSEEYSVNDLKANLNEIFWDKNKIWSTLDELSNDTISFHKYGFDDLIIAESHDLDKYSYDSFLDEVFFIGIKDKFVEPGNLESSDSYFKDIGLSSLTVKDKRVYWIYNNNIKTAHSLNYKCSPTLFVRLIPDYRVETATSTADKVAAIEIGFDTSTKKTLAELYKTTINCPLAKSYSNKIYELQNSINSELGVDYPFEVKTTKDGIISHISIDDDNSIKVYNEITRKHHQQTYKYKKIIIDELLSSIENLQDTIETHSSEDDELLNVNEQAFKTTFEIKSLGEVEDISKNTPTTFDEVNVIDQDTIEVLKASFDEYDVTYLKKKTGENIKESYVNLNAVHKMLFRCKGNIIISVYSNSMDYIYDKYNQVSVDNAIKASRNNLLKDVAGIKKACEKI